VETAAPRRRQQCQRLEPTHRSLLSWNEWERSRPRHGLTTKGRTSGSVPIRHCARRCPDRWAVRDDRGDRLRSLRAVAGGRTMAPMAVLADAALNERERELLDRFVAALQQAVVPATGGRPPPRRRAVARRRNPAPSSHAGRAVHVDDPVAPQRGRRGTRRRSCPSALRGQPRLGRERLGRRPRRATRTARRREDAGDLQRVGDRRRLPGLTRRRRRRSGTLRPMHGPAARAARYPTGNGACRTLLCAAGSCKVRIARVQAHWLPVLPTVLPRQSGR
jgi:hypothetical protein